jgi:hypothetical protein
MASPSRSTSCKNGDTIELGKYRLKYVAELPQQTSNADFEKTMILRPGAKPAAPPPGRTAPAAARRRQAPAPAAATPSAQAHSSTSPGMAPASASAPPPAAAALPLGAIQLLSGGNAGKEMELTKTLTTLGKPGVQVAVIARRPHGYFITHVEGRQLPGGQRQGAGCPGASSWPTMT